MKSMIYEKQKLPYNEHEFNIDKDELELIISGEKKSIVVCGGKFQRYDVLKVYNNTSKNKKLGDKDFYIYLTITHVEPLSFSGVNSVLSIIVKEVD